MGNVKKTRDGPREKLEARKRNEVWKPTAYANLDLTEVEINAMTRPERIDLLNSLDYHRKYQLLTLSDDMDELVKSMPSEDIYYTIEAAGRTDAMELVAATTPGQMTSIIDITCWDKDRLDEDELLDWFGYLIQHDPETAIKKVSELDRNLVAQLINRFVKVQRFEWNDDRRYIDDDMLFSLDDSYIFELLDPASKSNERFVVFIQMLYRLNFDLYRLLMETLIWETDANLDEIGYIDHAGRMADRGYPDYYNAIGLLSPTDPEALKRRWTKTEGREAQKEIIDPGEELPAFYERLTGEETFFNLAMKSLDGESEKGIRNELVHLGNLILVAKRSLSDIELVHSSLDEARTTLSLGLEYLSDGDIGRAGALLLIVPLKEVFRAGHSLAFSLHKQAKAFHGKHIAPHGPRALGLLSSPTRELFTGLLRTPPLYYSGAELKGGLITRPFEKLLEIERARTLLDGIGFLFDLHFRVLAQDYRPVLEGPARIGLEPIDPDLRFVKLFLTLYAHASLGGEADYRPLEAADFETFLKNSLKAREERSDKGYGIKAGFVDNLEGWLDGYLASESDGYRYLAHEWARKCGQVFDALARGVDGLTRSDAISLSQVLLLK